VNKIAKVGEERVAEKTKEDKDLLGVIEYL
jgi:hypothetical protein